MGIEDSAARARKKRTVWKLTDIDPVTGRGKRWKRKQIGLVSTTPRTQTQAEPPEVPGEKKGTQPFIRGNYTADLDLAEMEEAEDISAAIAEEKKKP